MLCRRLLLMGLCAAALCLAAEKVVGGPFVVNVEPRAATVAWIVETSEVKLGPAPGNWTMHTASLRSEKVAFTGLEPGKTYHYHVAAAGPAGKGSFKTPPVAAAPFQFVVFGDTRTRHEMHKKLIAAVAPLNPDFAIHTGDLVANGSDTSQWPAFFSIERELLSKTAFFPVIGNHERNNRQFYEFFDLSYPYYTFNWGSAHFIVLNTDVGNIAVSEMARDGFWAEQMRWLEADLEKNAKADFIFVVCHHPPFTAMSKRQKHDERMEMMVELLEKYKVTAMFNGHDHNYQHHLKNGVHYIVTGGGGAPLYPVDASIPGVTQKVVSTEHFVTVKIEGKTARAEAIGLDGRILDTVQLKP
ncbi:MAG: metallophosphoesterase [Acidobacteriales bacterium]|nr:metallophosphoesterase [Terriglobales bacterium]